MFGYVNLVGVMLFLFPFCDFEPNPVQTDNDLSGFKTFFDKQILLIVITRLVNLMILLACKYYSCDEFISIPSKSKSLSFFHVNISTLEKHVEQFSSLFFRLRHDFDVIGISETRLSHASSGNISLPGYSFLHTPSDSNAGGVGLYISNKYTFKPRLDLF